MHRKCANRKSYLVEALLGRYSVSIQQQKTAAEKEHGILSKPLEKHDDVQEEAGGGCRENSDLNHVIPLQMTVPYALTPNYSLIK